MKKILITLAIFSSLLSAQADVAEANVTVQIKLLMKQPNSIKGKYELQTITSASYKTIDLIQRLAPGRNFTSKARLIARTGSSTSITFLIREKDKADLDVTSKISLNFSPHVNPGRAVGNLVESKVLTGVGTGTYKNTGLGYVHLAEAVQNPAIELLGPLTLSRRFIEPKTGPNDGLIATTASLTGTGSFDFLSDNPPRIGIAQGSFKITAPKIIRTPAP